MLSLVHAMTGNARLTQTLRVVLGTLAVCLTGLVLALAIILFPKWLLWHADGMTANRPDLPELENSYRQTVVQVLGGSALLVGLYLTWKRIRAAEQQVQVALESQITERFTRGIEQLGSDGLSIRLGGIYGLERIARDSFADHWTVMEVLTAFVRTRRAPGRKTEDESSIDIEAALRVVGRRNSEHDRGIVELKTVVLDNLGLSGVQLAGVDLWRAQLRDADLAGADLSGAHLHGAVLDRASLEGAKLDDANLRQAHLESAILFQASLRSAQMSGVTLKGAILMQADLEGAHLSHANLESAVLTGASLNGCRLLLASFVNATLEDADLTAADLRKADFTGARVKGADFTSARLEGANLREVVDLTRAQLRLARLDTSTLLPSEFADLGQEAQEGAAPSTETFRDHDPSEDT